MFYNFDILNLFREDFHYQGKFYHNDSPECWFKGNVSAVGDDSFSYSLSSLGFRSDEFLGSEFPILFMGCSNTYGLGLPIKQIWAHRIYTCVKNKIGKNIPYWNIAKNGSSIDLQYLILERFIEDIKPKFIFFLIPSIYRRIFYYQGQFVTANIKDLLQENRTYDKTISKALKLFADESSALFESYKFLRLIEGITNRYDTTIFYQFCNDMNQEEVDFFDDRLKKIDRYIKLNTKWVLVDWNDRARDRMHLGPKSHEAFSDGVWNEVKGYF